MSKLSLPIIVTPSRVELGLRCHRRHVLSDLLQKGSYYSPSLEFGSVIHAGAGAWWKDKTRIRAENAVENEWNKRFVKNPQVSQKDVSLPMAIAMQVGYEDKAQLAGPFMHEPGNWQLVTVEERFEIPLAVDQGIEAKLSFQIDRLVHNKTTGHLVVIDTKTSARMDKRWERQWETSLQMKLYKLAVSKLYDVPPEDVDVVIEGVLKNVPSEVKYVVCPDWSPALLEEALEQAKYIAFRDWQMIAGTNDPEHYALTQTNVNYMSCYEYGVECPFRKLCVAEPDQRVALLHAEYFDINTEEY